MSLPFTKPATIAELKPPVDLPIRGDDRGQLSIVQAGDPHLPFEQIARVFYIYGTQEGVSRGFHAHHECEQLVVCVSGSVRFTLDNGHERQDFLLTKPQQALHIPTYVWNEMRDFSTDAVLVVFASHAYNETEYIRDYEEFKRLTTL